MLRRLIALVTVIEDVALIAWLSLVRTTRQALGLGVLFIGLVIEHILSYNIVNRRPLLNLQVPIREIATFSAIETVIWAVALLIFRASGAEATLVFLTIALTIEHSLSDSVNNNQPLFLRVVKPKVVIPSLIEGLGCTAWFYQVLVAHNILAGIVVLVVFNLIEHLILLVPADA